MRVLRSLVVFAAISAGAGWAATGSNAPPAPAVTAADDPTAALDIRHGTFPLDGGLARVETGEAYGFISGANAGKLLVDIWGNPKEAMEGVLGVIVPAKFDPHTLDSWAVVITYDAIGHVDDEDASSIDADELLAEMKKDEDAVNAERKKLGYPAITLVGWARPPAYDSVQKKAVWAEHLRFEGDTVGTLNYRIRVLGRSGVLVLNAVAAMDQLKMIEKEEPGILHTASFLPGNTYSDFNASTDETASFGVAGLIAGGLVAAKGGGFLKVLLAALAASWKFIAVGVLAVGAFVARLFGRKSSPPPGGAG